MVGNDKKAKFLNWDAFRKIQVIKVGEKEKVLLDGRPYMSWADKDQAARRVAIAQLYELGLATQEELAEAFGVHVNSVYNYITRFEKDGVAGLLSQRPGPNDPWKITPETRFKVLEIAFNNEDISCEKISNLLKKRWNIEISISGIHRVLTENGFVSQPIKRQNRESTENLFELRDHEQLLFRDLNNPGQAFLDTEDLPEQVAREQAERTEENRIIFEEGVRESKLSFYSSAERIYLNRLEHGGFSTYAGGLLFIPLLQQYNFLPTIKRVIDIETYEGYSLEQLCLTLLYCDIFGFRSIENFKTVYPEEFGVLIGKLLSPSIFTIRRFLHKVRKLKKGEQLMEEFGKEYLRSGLVRWGVLYADAHFLPYYGVYIITMGWHGVKQMPMKGSYNFMAIDDEFNPLIFFIRPSSEDLVEKIPELILKAKNIAKEVGIADDKLMVVFDREGYSAELFREFDSAELNARFVTWAKYFDKWGPSIKEEQFNKSVVVNYELQEREEVKYFEAEDRVMKKYGKVRTIVIQSGRKKKQSAIYTNDRESEAALIIQLICRRWGQETLFKTLKLDHRIDYFPGYEPEELEKQPMVENPKVEELKKAKANLVKDLHRLKLGFVDILLDKVSDEITWQEIKEKKIKTVADIQSVRTQMLLIDQEIDKLPKVRFDEAHNGTKLTEFDYEKKRFLDSIKIFSYTIQKKACQILSKYYDNPEDVWQTLAMISRRGADIKLEGNILTVKLKKFTNEVIDYAARHLCEELNAMIPVTLDKFHFQLRYEVE